MSESIQHILNRQDWEPIITKLTAYVINLCKYPPYSLPGGKEPEDIVMDAIEKVYTGDRQWDPEMNPDFYLYLKSVIKSLVSNEKTSNASKLMQAIPEHFTVSHEDGTEEELYCYQIDVFIQKKLPDDDPLRLIYKALKDGYKPAQIATDTGLEIATIRNLQKRLSRELNKILSPLIKVYSNGKK